MSYQKGVLTCDGCRAPIDPRGEHVTLTSRPCVGAISIPEDYHQHCWQTGWYTGIEPKGGWPSLPDLLSTDEGGDIEPTFDHIGNQVLSPEDPVNSPSHYRWLPNGIEVIDITESFNFLLGNVLKYVMRADHKGKPLEDLKKARWYLDREIARRESGE